MGRVKTIAVVGASLAGLSAVRALRDLGWDGRVVVVGDEAEPPYDRPPLSKGFLLGETGREGLLLDPGWADLAEWRLGVRAVGLDVRERAVLLDTGERLAVAGVVAATGARALGAGLVPDAGSGPASDTGPDTRSGVHSVRTLADAEGLRAELGRARRLVVVGGGFVGLEVAACARTLGLEVELVTSGAQPLDRTLGPAAGARMAALHRDRGVALRLGTRAVRTVLDGSGRFAAVELDDGRRVAGDALVVGVGSRPVADWVGPAVDRAPVSGGVVTAEDGTTTLPWLVAAGDCTALRLPDGTLERQEHWTRAATQPRYAVAALLGASLPVRPRDRVPYVWSDQFGRHLQYAGRHRPGDVLVDEPTQAAAPGGWLATYRRGGPEGPVVAAVGLDDPRGFTRLRRELARSPEYREVPG